MLLKALVILLVLSGASVHATDRLRVGVPALASAKFNPWASPNPPGVFLLGAVFDGLTRLDSAGEPQPWLATSWSSEDALTWKIALRDDVVFSSGRSFGAQDVAFALNYLTSGLTMREVLARDFASVIGVEVLSDTELLIRLATPDVLFPRLLSQLWIPDSEIFQSVGAEKFALAPVGTGPFELKYYSEKSLQFSANRKSWRPSQLDELEVLVLSEPSTRLNGLLAGRIDIAMSLGLDDQYLLERADAKLIAASLPSVFGFVFISTREGMPLHSRAVRQALSHAIDTRTIAQVVLGDLGGLATQATPRTAFGYNDSLQPYEYNPELARELLAKAGFPSGFEMTAELIPDFPIDTLVMQKIADDLSRVGVVVRLKTITYANYVSNFRTGEWDGDAFGMVFSTEPTLDALTGIRPHSCAWPGNWYCSQEITPLIERAVNAVRIEDRRALTEKVMAYYHEDAPAVMLFEYPFFFGLSGKVQGFQVTHSFISWDKVYLKK